MPSQAKPSQAKPSQAKPSQAKPSQAKPSQAKPSQAKPSQAKPSQAKPSQAKPSQANFKLLILFLGFEFEPNGDIYTKSIGESRFEVDFKKEKLTYPKEVIINELQTCNFSQNENFVVFECVHRLVGKGYHPSHIELEPKWKLGHDSKSGRADILVRNQLKEPLLIIECKTAGREFEKAWKDTQADGAQLFSYIEQEKATQFICLYASAYDEKSKQLNLDQRIISVKDNAKILDENPKTLSFAKASNNKERVKAWQTTYQAEFTETGIFEDNILPYHIGKEKYTLAQDTKPIDSMDIKGAYHKFRTILRKHNVSRRENAFEVLVNLFLCKIVDELENPEDLKFYWKGIAYDNYFDLVDRLQSLYKTGMERFLDQDIVYISNAQIDEAFWALKGKRNATKLEIKKIFRELKFYKGLDFEFIKVFNKAYFDKNAKILLEIIQMWQGSRLTSSNQNQFLGDMFEYFLDNGIKQSEGQFFTPVPICKFIVSALPLEQMIATHSEPLKAIDYASGSGHFLTEYAVQLPPLLKSIKHTDDAAPYYQNIYGIEKEDRLAKVAKVSAFMYGFKDIHIIDADALVPHADIKEAGFNLIIANPPFAVEDFLLTIDEEHRDKFTLTKNVDGLGNKNIQCFFLERAQQLLTGNGVMGVIVPSSILSNSDAMHVATREILLKYFDFIAITELGSNTFGKTDTNTVVLFLRRKAQRPEPCEHYHNRVLDFFDNWEEESKSGGGAYLDIGVVRQYCAHIGVDDAAYQTLLLGQPSDELLAFEMFRDYQNDFNGLTEIKKLKENKAFKAKNTAQQTADLSARLTQYLIAIEQDKLYTFMLAHNNPCPVVLVKSPADNKAQKQFLGYEWSGAKGSEGIVYNGGDTVYNIQTPMFDPNSRDNDGKISHIIRQNFMGEAVTIPPHLSEFVCTAQLTDLLDFSRTDFKKEFSLTVKKANAEIESKWELVKLGEVAQTSSGGTPLSTNIDYYQNGDIPWINSGEVGQGEIWKSEKFITEEGLKNSSAKIFSEETVLLAMYGATAGKVGILKIKASTNQAVCGIVPDERLLPKFLYLQLSSMYEYLLGLRTGIARDNLSQSKINNIKIPLPPLNIQQDIVAACEEVDEAMRVAQQTVDTENQRIERQFEQARSQQVKKLRLNDASLFELSIGKRVLKSEINETGEGLPVYSANVFHPFGFTTKTLLDDFNQSSVLWGIDGDWMVNCLPANTPFYPTDHCGVLRIKNNAVEAEYAAWVLRKEGERVRFSRHNRASIDRVSGIFIEVPDLEIQTQLVQNLNQSKSKITTAQAVIDAAPGRKQDILREFDV